MKRDFEPVLHAARTALRKGRFAEALRLYGPIEDHLDAQSIAHYGSCKLAAGDADGASEQFEKALKVAPDDANLLTRLACARELQGQDEEAAKLYRKVIAQSPNAGIAYVNLGYMMLIRGNLNGATQCLAQVLESSSPSIEPHLVLPKFNVEALPSQTTPAIDRHISASCTLIGRKLQEVGRFEEAHACFTHAVALNELSGHAYGSMAVVRKLTQQDAPLIAKMQELVGVPEVESGSHARLFFALGKAMDDLGEYERAITYFDEANRLQKEEMGSLVDHSVFKADLNRIIATYTKERVQTPDSYGSKSDLPLLIVGMMRSGTTLAEQIVSSHPDVAGGEEQLFWSDNGYRQISSGSRPPNPTEAARLARAYLTLLRGIDPDARRVTDKMPQNFMAIGLIHRVLPNARIVCLRRNPIDTCLSIYMTDFRHPIPFVNSRDDLVFFYRQFERMMDHWRQVIPANRLMEVNYEDLLSDREATTRRLVDFCGLEWDNACLHPEENQRTVKTASVWQVRQGVYTTSMERWRRYEPWLGSLNQLR
jgi:tetratricopeptide (TPR) repeat protein